jgi:multimeric flavodoxin WrbA
MKKIVIINASMRKKNTFNLLKEIEHILKNKYKIEFINLSDANIKSCFGCEMCLKTSDCHLKDDFDIIEEKLKNADGIIFGTPVYLRNISSTLKNFIDRTSKWYHRPILFGIPVMSVITTAYSGFPQSDAYLKDVYLQWGANYSMSIKKTAMKNKAVEESNLKKFIRLIEDDSSRYSPTIKQLIEFKTQKVLAYKILEKDFEYWRDINWLEKDYFYECRINPLKKAIAWSYFHLLMKVIPKRY